MDASASKMISSDISCGESFETDAVLLVVVVIMKIVSCCYLGASPSIQNNKLNQWNLVLQTAVVTSWTLADWKIYTGVHVTIVQSCQHLLNVYNFCEEFPDLKDKLNDACITDTNILMCYVCINLFSQNNVFFRTAVTCFLLGGVF